MRKTILSLTLLLSVEEAAALPNRNVSFGVGLGVPEVVSAHAQVMVSQRWQIGLGYTYVPNIAPLGEPQELPSQNVRLVDGNDYAVTPTLTPSVNFLSPFVRYYPDDNNFYMQFMYSMFRMSGQITGEFEDVALSALLPGAVLGGSVTLTQAVPTVSLGYVFSSNLFYVNFAIGASWIGTISANVDINTELPDSVGAEAANEAALNALTEEIQTAAQNAVEEARSELRFVPSIYISFGFFL